MIAASEAMYDFVAATLCSVPAHKGMVKSAARANGEVSTFTSAMIIAPAAFALATAASRSGLAPDWEIASNTVPRKSAFAAYTELTDGAAEEVSTPRRVSIMYLAKVAAWSELPRAQVTTARGESRRRVSPNR